ncbi:ABC transporter ATP-binding protein [Parazoarcus communis]|uniref:ABC transporter ATP-binding protein n=1 Tax=Parazoarcus communis TaxID=41977 RepID=A0A2U8H442_9RHOO|nr:ABC transporter ATP-binding protein [Parazoarcus communis]AWI80829.1 ABC transporter ATP-binding protein [Parazoarcus communis]
MNGNALLSCCNLQAGYDASKVLFDVSFAIRPGEVIGLLGRNGMGKSTTIKCITGALSPSQGEIRFRGEQVAGRRMDTIARMGVATVPEGRQCFPNLSVSEHLTAFAENRSRTSPPWTRERIYALFPRLAERANNMGDQLSGGEQQMLAIGRALSTNPHLLILDEATEGLAPLIREEIWRCISALKAQGQTILIVDKYVDKLVQLADRHLILERGRLVWSGSSAELDADRSLWHRYMGV